MANLLHTLGTFLQGIAESVVFGIIVFGSLFARPFYPVQRGRLVGKTAQSSRTSVCKKHEEKYTETEDATVQSPQTPRNAPENQDIDNDLSTPQSQIIRAGTGPTPGTPLPGHPTTMVVATRTTSPPSSHTLLRPRNLEASLLAVASFSDLINADPQHDEGVAVGSPTLCESEDSAQDVLQAVAKDEAAVASATCLSHTSPPPSGYDVPTPRLICAIEKAPDGDVLYDDLATVKVSTPVATINVGTAAPTVARPAAAGILRGGFEDEEVEMLEHCISQPIFPSPFKNEHLMRVDESDCAKEGIQQAIMIQGDGDEGDAKAVDVQGDRTYLELIMEIPDTPLWPTAAGDPQLEACRTLSGQEPFVEQSGSLLLEQQTGETLSNASLVMQALMYSPTLSTPAPFASAVTIAVDAVSTTAPVQHTPQVPLGDQCGGATTASEGPCFRRSSKKLDVSLEPALAAAATAPQPETADRALVRRGSRISDPAGHEPAAVKAISTPPPGLQHAHCSCCHSAVDVLSTASSSSAVPRYAAPTVSSLSRRTPRPEVKLSSQRRWDSTIGLPGVQSYTPKRLSMRRTLAVPMVSPIGGQGAGGQGAAAPASGFTGAANVLRRRGGVSMQLPNRG